MGHSSGCERQQPLGALLSIQRQWRLQVTCACIMFTHEAMHRVVLRAEIFCTANM
jgi:hypothetical protein